MSIVILFNDGLSVMAEAIQALLSEKSEITKIIVSHKNPYFIGFNLADECIVETAGGDAKAYVDWVFDLATSRGVTHFFVGRHALAISNQKARFEEAGITLMFSLEPDQWHDIDDKGLFYGRLKAAGHDFMLPIWHQWADNYSEGLSPLVQSILSASQTHPRTACVKPVRGIFGQGFFRFEDNPDPAQQLLAPEEKIMSFADFGRLACAASIKSGKVSQWMVMEFLPGPEYSVDTLAYDGKIVTYVARKKSDIAGEGQVIAGDEDIAEQLNILADVFKLSGVFNAQFRRDAEGKLKVMEINPRFSGGMGMSLKAGVNLPLWWLNMEISKGADAHKAPQALVGMRVYSWHMATTIHDHREPELAA